MKMSKAKKYERLEKLEDAQQLIHQAADLILEAMDGTEFGQGTETYIVAHLKNWADGNNPYDATAIPRLMENIESIS